MAFLYANLEFFKNWINFEGKSTRFQFNSVYFGMAFLVLTAMLPLMLTAWLLGAGIGHIGQDNILSMLIMLCIFLTALTFTVIYFVGFLALSWRRARDCGLPPLCAICMFIPVLNFVFSLVMIFKPTVEDKKVKEPFAQES